MSAGTLRGPAPLHVPLHALATLALPPRCPGCGVPTEADHRFCAPCWTSLRFIAPPWCAGCNAPFAYDRGATALCGDCLAEAPRHAGVRAAVAYGDVARDLALRLKYAGRTGFAGTMARQIARSVPAEVSLLAPVPLYRWRLWSRGFNQAALIADALATITALPCARDALVRHRRTPVLRGLGGGARARAVRGAFRIVDHAAVKGHSVGLVDDVYTSGATADACTRLLLAAGASSVTILCWARVLPDTASD